MSDNEEQKKIPGPPLSYVDILNVTTDEKIEKDAEKIYNPIRPSASGSCERELAYKLMEFTGQAKYEKNLITAEVNRIFSSGHALEFDLIKQFRLHASEFFQIKYTQQTLIFKKIDWPSRPDLHMWLEGQNDMVFWSDEYKCVADVKTKKDKFSKYYSTDWDETTVKLSALKTAQKIGVSGTGFWIEDLEAFLDELNDPFFAANFLQLNLYANSDFMVTKGIDHASIIQYNKNDSRLREIRFRPSRALYFKVLAKFDAAISAADKGDPELAKRDYVIGNIKCAFCDYKKVCWNRELDEDPLKSYFKTLPKKFWARDIEQVKEAEKLKPMFKRYKEALDSSEQADGLMKRIIELMVESNTRKIKLEDGTVFELKDYKSPRPHIKLVRSKN